MSGPRLAGIDLLRMRATAEESFPDAVELWRPTLTPDGAGGVTSADSRVWSGAARKAPLTTVASVDQVYADRLGGSQGWWISLPIGPDVALGDRIVDAATRTYEVVGADAGRSNPISQRVLCRELT